MFALLAGVVFVVDQLTKTWVRASIEVNVERIDVLPFLELRHVRNTGIAFGLFSGQTQLVVIGAVIVTGLLLVTLTTVPPEDRLTSVALALVAGGALGNLFDRVRQGHVTDFIHVSHWPTFNIADCAIVGGVALALLGQLLSMLRERRLDADRS